MIIELKSRREIRLTSQKESLSPCLAVDKDRRAAHAGIDFTMSSCAKMQKSSIATDLMPENGDCSRQHEQVRFRDLDESHPRLTLKVTVPANPTSTDARKFD